MCIRDRENVLRAARKVAVRRGLVLQQNGHIAVVGGPAAEVGRRLAPFPKAFVSARLTQLQIAARNVLRAAHQPDDVVTRALKMRADVKKALDVYKRQAQHRARAPEPFEGPCALIHESENGRCEKSSVRFLTGWELQFFRLCSLSLIHISCR